MVTKGNDNVTPNRSADNDMKRNLTMVVSPPVKFASFSENSSNKYIYHFDWPEICSDGFINVTTSSINVHFPQKTTCESIFLEKKVCQMYTFI